MLEEPPPAKMISSEKIRNTTVRNMLMIRLRMMACSATWLASILLFAPTLLAKACDTPTAIPFPSPITMKNIGNITLTAA